MAQSTNGVKTANPESKILNDSYLELPLQLFLGCSSMLGGSSSRVEMDHALVTSSPISMFFLIFLCNQSCIKTVCAVHAFNIENEKHSIWNNCTICGCFQRKLRNGGDSGLVMRSAWWMLM